MNIGIPWMPGFQERDIGTMGMILSANGSFFLLLKYHGASW